jgi:hypothetical protein
MNPNWSGIDSSTQWAAPEEVLGSEPEEAEGAGTDSEAEDEPDAIVDYDAV